MKTHRTFTLSRHRHALGSTRALVLTCALFAQSGLAPTPAAALDVGAKQPELGLVDRAGKRVDLEALKGKVVLVDFWASWCAPCKLEMPVLERLHKKYHKQGLVVVGVSVDSDDANIGDFLKTMPVSFPIVHDKDHKVAGRYQPPRMPSSYIVDRTGVVRHVHGGFRQEDAAKLEAEVVALLAR